jgi:predicted lipoprotein with Yx(FWY)xxD motif
MRLVLIGIAALSLLATGCGDDDDGGDDDAATSTTAAADDGTTTTSGDDTSTTEASGGASVEVADTDLGEVLVSDGMTLYLFTPDDGGPSTCETGCIENWPPLLATGQVAVGEGLDQELFGTSPRDDGAGDQVTVDGWPLYFYSGDSEPGDTNGQGVGGVWYAVGPDGAAVEEGG